MISGGDHDALRRQLNKLPELLTRAQVAAVVQVSERTVDRHIVAGRLKAQRTNGHVRIQRNAVLAWLGLLLLALLILLGYYATRVSQRAHAARQEARLDRRQNAVRRA